MGEERLPEVLHKEPDELLQDPPSSFFLLRVVTVPSYPPPDPKPGSQDPQLPPHHATDPPIPPHSHAQAQHPPFKLSESHASMVPTAGEAS